MRAFRVGKVGIYNEVIMGRKEGVVKGIVAILRFVICSGVKHRLLNMGTEASPGRGHRGAGVVRGRVEICEANTTRP